MTEKQGYLGDLSKSTKPQLLELLERQEKLLAKKQFIEKLPDKGSRIKNLCSKIKEAIQQKENIDSTADLFAKLQIREEKPSINFVEDLDSDDDFPDVNGNDELDFSPISHDTKLSSKPNVEGELSADRLARKFDSKTSVDINPLPKTKLLKNADIKKIKESSPSHVGNEMLASKKALHYWGESAVLPPSYSSKPAKLLTLQESMELIQEQNKALDLVEKLSHRVKFAVGDPPFNTISQSQSEENDDILEEEEGDEEN